MPEPTNALRRGAVLCACTKPLHPPRLVALTGGPGAGKTAVLEAVQKSLCVHLIALPEAASIVFGGGFPRLPSEVARRAAQRAIFHTQRGLEELVVGEGDVALALCDRGSLDGLAYWPDDEASWLRELGAAREGELARYAAVVHLRVPAPQSYDHTNALRIETAAEASAVDARIEHAWRGHPNRSFVDRTETFVEKLATAVERLRAEMPPCCRGHLPGLLEKR